MHRCNDSFIVIFVFASHGIHFLVYDATWMLALNGPCVSPPPPVLFEKSKQHNLSLLQLWSHRGVLKGKIQRGLFLRTNFHTKRKINFRKVF